MDSQFTRQSRGAKFLIQLLHQQPNQTGKDSGEGGEHERGPARLTDFEVRTRNVVMNVASLVKFHQHKRDNETHRGPFQATQSKIKHPNGILTIP
jgi:hypothetical protein